MSDDLYAVRIVFDEDGVDIAIDYFNTYPEAREYQKYYEKKHKDNDCIRTVYVKKRSQDEFTHRVYHPEWEMTYFMGTEFECEMYQAEHDVMRTTLVVEEVSDSG
jgi:hypothetical protein